MGGMFTFIKKEIIEKLRTGKLVIFMIISVLFGILNPAIAKLTPYLLEKFADSEQGVKITMDTDGALMAWQQFGKNMPMLIIIMCVLFASTVVSEFQKGTIIPVITKGLSKQKIIIAKFLVMFLTWTVGYIICFYITYFYTAFYWDNKVVQDMGTMVLCYWLFGVMILSLIILFSTIVKETTGVIIGVGLVYFIMSLLSIAKTVAEYLPTKLMDGGLITGGVTASDYTKSLIITGIVCVGVIILSLFLIKDKNV